MKKLRSTLLVVLTLWMGSSFAQSDTTGAGHKRTKRSYEMGMSLSALTLRAGDFYSNYHLQLDNQVFSGIYLKCFRGQHAWRFGIDYSQRNIYTLGQSNSNSNRLRSLEIKAGYQRMLGKKKLAVYSFADLEYNFIYRQGVSDQWASPFIYSNYAYNGNYSFSGHFLCVIPGLGLRWQVAKSIVLNAESGAQLFYVSEIGNDYAYGQHNSLGINAKALKISIGFTF